MFPLTLESRLFWVGFIIILSSLQFFLWKKHYYWRFHPLIAITWPWISWLQSFMILLTWTLPDSWDVVRLSLWTIWVNGCLWKSTSTWQMARCISNQNIRFPHPVWQKWAWWSQPIPHFYSRLLFILLWQGLGENFALFSTFDTWYIWWQCSMLIWISQSGYLVYVGYDSTFFSCKKMCVMWCFLQLLVLPLSNWMTAWIAWTIHISLCCWILAQDYILPWSWYFISSSQLTHMDSKYHWMTIWKSSEPRPCQLSDIQDHPLLSQHWLQECRRNYPHHVKCLKSLSRWRRLSFNSWYHHWDTHYANPHSPQFLGSSDDKMILSQDTDKIRNSKMIFPWHHSFIRPQHPSIPSLQRLESLSSSPASEVELPDNPIINPRESSGSFILSIPTEIETPPLIKPLAPNNTSFYQLLLHAQLDNKNHTFSFEELERFLWNFLYQEVHTFYFSQWVSRPLDSSVIS